MQSWIKARPPPPRTLRATACSSATIMSGHKGEARQASAGARALGGPRPLSHGACRGRDLGAGSVRGWALETAWARPTAAATCGKI